MPLTVVIQPDSIDGFDTYINEAAAATNYKTATGLYTGLGGSSTTHYKALIRFPLLLFIPRRAIIQSATLHLNIESVGDSANGQNIFLGGIKEDWVQTEATWDVKSSGAPWSGGGGLGGNSNFADNGTPSRENDIAIADLVAPTTGLKTYDIPRSLVQDMLEERNFGFVITNASHGSLNRYLIISSCESTTVANRPKLTVVYEPYHKVFAASAGLGF